MAYDRYLLGQYLMERRRRDGNLEDALALFNECIDLDPGFGPAYLALAEIYVLLPDYRGWDLAQAHSEALDIIERGIEADPAIEDAAASVFGFVYHKRRQWAEAEASIALAALDAAGEQRPLDPQVETTARVILGDVEGALTVAWSLLKPGQTYETEFLFLDELAALRARPEFLQLLTSLGITEYWQQAGCYWQEQAVRCD